MRAVREDAVREHDTARNLWLIEKQNLEHATGFEPVINGFADRRLCRLATRACAKFGKARDESRTRGLSRTGTALWPSELRGHEEFSSKK